MFARVKQSRFGQIIQPRRPKDAVGAGVVEVPGAQDNAVQSDGGSADSPRQETAPLPMPLGGWDPIGVRPRFGSYRGLARLMLAHLESVAGRFSGYQQIRWEKVKRVVFVCHGNICRSPYAERRAETYGLTVASFGLSADAGMPADPTACRIAARRAIELAPHRARDIKDFEFRRGDLLAAWSPGKCESWVARLPFRAS